MARCAPVRRPLEFDLRDSMHVGHGVLHVADLLLLQGYEKGDYAEEKDHCCSVAGAHNLSQSIALKKTDANSIDPDKLTKQTAVIEYPSCLIMPDPVADNITDEHQIAILMIRLLVSLMALGSLRQHPSLRFLGVWHALYWLFWCLRLAWHVLHVVEASGSPTMPFRLFYRGIALLCFS